VNWFEHIELSATPSDGVVALQVRSGTNVLVCGPNGCGKSSLFRVLGEVRRYLRDVGCNGLCVCCASCSLVLNKVNVSVSGSCGLCLEEA